MKYFATLFDKEYDIEVSGSEDKLEIKVNGRMVEAQLRKSSSDGLYSVNMGKRQTPLFIAVKDGHVELSIGGKRFPVEIEDETSRKLRSVIRDDKDSSTEQTVRAPMPGLIAKIFVEVGQTVAAGEPLFIIEAMKMENEIRAAAASTVIKVSQKEKSSVEKNAIVMVLNATT